MSKRLEKARKDPESMKAKLLSAARKLFGEYGFHGTTTRMIAKEVGIDISTLYYHWGEKKDLFEAVILDVREDFQDIVTEIENKTRELPKDQRYDLAIESVCEFLDSHPECPNIMLFQMFSKIKQDLDPKLASNRPLEEVGIAMGFDMNDPEFSKRIKAGMLAGWFSAFSFFAGEDYIRPMFDMDHDAYKQMVKNTMKRILIPGSSRRGKN